MIGVGKKVLRRVKKDYNNQITLFRQNAGLKNFRNIHEGMDCVIMGAGPSLNEIPHEFLKKCIVIGTNLSFKQT